MIRPTRVHYEQLHLKPEEKEKEARALMKQQGYTYWESRMDVLACQVVL
jgi:hypothetical protein